MSATLSYKTPTNLGLNGVTTTTNGTWIQMDTSYNAQIGLLLTNGASGPTTAAQFQVQVAANYNGGSPANPVNFGGPLVGGLANNGTYSWGVEIPLGWAAFRVVFTQSSGGTAVTGTADASLTTGI